MKLTKADHERISAAIGQAEAATSGEIFCILARRVGEYREASVAWAAGVAFLLPIIAIPLGFRPDRLPFIGADWQAAHTAALDQTITSTLTAYVILQALVFVAALTLFSIPAVRRATTPRALKRLRVRKAAVEQFMAKGLHLTQGHTGVLIFAAIAERQVEIIADEAIHKAVGKAEWAATVDALTAAIGAGRPADGFVEAVERCGRVLAQHFPPQPGKQNELPNEVVEI